MREKLSESFNSEAKQLFDDHIKGKNIMTPNIIGYGVHRDFAYELSSGEGINREPIFGVTILERKSGYHRHDLSKMFYSLEEARNYLKAL